FRRVLFRSGIVALTLTPALCAVLLRPPSEHATARSPLGRFFDRFNRGFRAATERYLGAAGRVIDRPRTFFAAFGVVVALVFVLIRSVPSGFIPSEDKGYFAMLGAVNGYLFGMRDARGFAFNLPEIIGLGTNAGLEMNLQDRGVNDVQRFAALVNDFTRDANGSPDLRGVYSTLRVNTPQLYVQVDREKTKALGISLTDLFQTLQAFLSTLYINDFNLYGKTYRVQAEAQPKFRQTPDDIGRLYVRAPDQRMVPVSALTHTQFQVGPSVLTRFNGFTSALVIGAPAPGKSSGQMLDAVERLAQQKYAGQGMGYAFSGQSYQERASGGQGGLVFGLGLVMVFLVLAAQY